ncbi:MAG TPA: GNAT family N-acetyltransferase [Jiangellaceae bacterium]|nr:GNAT family N-acetyltransferase [Jiangellaceae bacterium]
MAAEPAPDSTDVWVDRIRADHVGRRVVVRYRLPAEDIATDVLGLLVERLAGALRIRRADGSVVDVPLADVVAAKPVPAHRVTRRDVRALETAAAEGWRAPDTVRLGGWLLRAAGGFTRRANSCLPLADPGMPVRGAVAEVERWYAGRGMDPLFQVIIPLAEAVDAHLDSLGWSGRSEDVLVMTAPLGPVADALRPGLAPVTVTAEPDDAWLAAYHYRGQTLPAHARHVLVDAETVGFASVDDGGRRVAIARGAVTNAPDGRRWVGITAVEVEPAARRRGLGTHVVAGTAVWARTHRASDVYLQVSADNAPALAAYQRLGFIEHHRYHYRYGRPAP